MKRVRRDLNDMGVGRSGSLFDEVEDAGSGRRCVALCDESGSVESQIAEDDEEKMILCVIVVDTELGHLQPELSDEVVGIELFQT